MWNANLAEHACPSDTFLSKSNNQSVFFLSNKEKKMQHEPWRYLLNFSVKKNNLNSKSTEINS
jgi:hypothetical protein